MKYYSLKGQSPMADFKEATVRGQAPDKGLYFPEYIPVLDLGFLYNIEQTDDVEIGYRVIHPYVGESIPEDALRKIIEQTINFPIPLVSISQDPLASIRENPLATISDNIFALEMYHGPTLAFKDVGARFMSRCLGYFGQSKTSGRTLVLVATSGDTGGAVANGFYEVPGVDVVILYPSGKVSNVQEKQLTTLGKNIHALEVTGNFDDCQQLVKRAFADSDITEKVFLTSANSINIARWLPQQFYYFLAWKQWPHKDQPPVVSVPSGNFGNLCAAILAHASGLPVAHFIAACNSNDVVPEFLKSGTYEPKQTVATISNAMDVGDPNNFVRILEIFDKDIAGLKRKLSAYSVTDDETRATIKRIYKKHHYLLDPHGAVGYLSLERYLEEHKDSKGYFVETAHPVKFYDVVEPVIEEKIPLPSSVSGIMDKLKVATKMNVDYDFLRSFLLQFD